MLVIGEVFYPEDFLINDLVSEWIEKGYDIEVLARAPSYPYGKTYKGYKNRIYQKDYYKGATVHRVGFVKGYSNSVVKKILNYILFVFLGTFVVLGIGRRFESMFIYHTGPLTLALPGIVAKKVYKLKTTIWTQDLWPDTVYAYGFRETRALNTLLTNIVKFVYKNCDEIFVTCQGFTEKLQGYIPDKKIKLAPNWPITTNTKKPDLDESIELPEGINFTFTGNIGKVQNLENVLIGFGEFQKEYPDANLNIIGDGSNLNKLKRLVEDHEINSVKFWGRYPVSTMPEFYKKSDVLVLSLIKSPTFELTIPLKFQTYLASGKPIFGIIEGDVATMIKENEIGFTAEPQSIKNIENEFREIVYLIENNPLSFNTISNNCNSLLKNSFDRQAIIENLTVGNENT